ncbi:MAG: hypothetical protein HKL96_10135 [Phycisphaerales bacterium]|nr:hypothetical protein [Phycisphaerales bacterium]
MSQPDFIFDEATEHALLAYVEGIASPQQHAAVEQLMRQDATLAKMVADMQANRQMLAAVPSVKAPPTLAAEVAKQVTARALHRRRHWLDTTAISLIAATLLVICLPLALLHTAPQRNLPGTAKHAALLNKALSVSAPRLALNAPAQHRAINQLQQTLPAQPGAHISFALPKPAMQLAALRQAAPAAVPVIILEVHTAAQRQAVMRQIANIRTATQAPMAAASMAAAGRSVGQAHMRDRALAKPTTQPANTSTWLLRLTPTQLHTLQQLAAAAPAPAMARERAVRLKAITTTAPAIAAAKNAATATAPAAASRLYKIIVRLTPPAPTKR